MPSEFGNEPIKFGIRRSSIQRRSKFVFFVFSHARVRAAHVPRADALRDDAFQVHPARMTKDSGPRAVSASDVGRTAQLGEQRGSELLHLLFRLGAGLGCVRSFSEQDT